MITLKPTKRDIIFDRFFEKKNNYEYFYYEEDPTVECDIELFGYSKFACDAAYEDDEVQWNYIVKDHKILGITAIKNDDDNLKIKFLEINSKFRGHGFGSETIEYFKSLKDNNQYKAILLYPKDKEVTIKPGSKINTKDYNDFLRNPYLSSTSDTSIKAIENMDNLDIKGEDLYELEYQGAMSSKNNKILHKVFFDNGKAIFEKDINDLFGNKMIYKNYSEKKELVI